MSRENNIGLIHFLGALFVMLGHQYVLLGDATSAMLFSMPIHELGIKVIFILIGYLMTESWYNTGSTLKYIKKRLKRLYPSYILSLILSIAVLGLLFSGMQFFQYLAASKDYFFKNLFMHPVFALPGVFENNIYPYTVNGSLWTMPVELLCYFLIIPIMKLCDKAGKYGNLIMVFIIAFLWVTNYMQVTGQITATWIFWGTEWMSSIKVLQCFFMGSLFSRAKLKKYCNLQIAGVLCVAFIFICDARNVYFLIAGRDLVIAYTTMSFAFAETPVFAKFKGKLSYGIYLYCFPIQQALIQLLVVRSGNQMAPIRLFFISLALTLFVAYYTDKFIDSLMGGKINSFIKERIVTDRMLELVKKAETQVDGFVTNQKKKELLKDIKTEKVPVHKAIDFENDFEDDFEDDFEGKLEKINEKLEERAREEIDEELDEELEEDLELWDLEEFELDEKDQ